ncbi:MULTISPECIES: head GIN domain-containing protein [Flavobacterium]|uniref:Head GIN domain-containing protein n=1 Tax=Flavobacterium sedimenticola TaxID=3043286 RepID=A0ABT6XPZ8_9FLAO|nr:head GIN domain-containing protein [Flavobacterium sedimenticola]MDI9257172.1 head GIN domain-containing protein [Flavobacterium sedimenticola]
MTKLVILFSKLITAVAVAVSLTSCNYNINLGKSITGSGNVVSVTRTVGSFDKVRVSRGLECEIIQSDKTEVIVEADDNLVNDIKTEVENGTLIISTEYSNYINVSSKKVIVRMPKIVSLEASSGSSLRSKGVLTGESVLVKSSSGSSTVVELEADTITLESSSGSEQNVRGKALKLNTASSSGSHIDADGLTANEVFAQSSSGSATSIHPVLLLDAKASSGSSISYTHSPQEIRKEESSGGSVSKD